MVFEVLHEQTESLREKSKSTNQTFTSKLKSGTPEAKRKLTGRETSKSTNQTFLSLLKAEEGTKTKDLQIVAYEARITVSFFSVS